VQLGLLLSLLALLISLMLGLVATQLLGLLVGELPLATLDLGAHSLAHEGELLLVGLRHAALPFALHRAAHESMTERTGVIFNTVWETEGLQPGPGPPHMLCMRCVGLRAPLLHAPLLQLLCRALLATLGPGAHEG
tara:strand:- start:3 stop:410 length:408 start_codon:yes stop_codon:yes gene_type:complete